MEKILKIVVNNEEDAFKISQELTELDNKDSISVAESFILTKDENGEVSLKDAKDGKISYTLGGAITGALIGLIGGPLGMLWGAALGSMAGVSGDILSNEQRYDHLERVGRSLAKGETALLVHLDEYWMVPLDSVLKKYNATITRYSVDEEIDQYIQLQLDTIDQDLHQLSDEVENTVTDHKASLNHKLAELSAKRKELQAKVNEKMQAQKKLYEKWLDKIKGNFHDVKDDIEDDIEDYKEEIAEEMAEIKEELKLGRKKRLEKRIANQEAKINKLQEQLEKA